MPTVDRIDGLKINIYNGDHRPAHVHAIYAEFEALLIIENSEIYAGYLPENEHRKDVQWLEDHRDWALSVFFELNQNLI